MSGVHSHVPYGPEGIGFYSNRNNVCFAAMDKFSPLVLDALGDITCVKGAFTVVDYGAADGGISMGLFRDIIGKVKKRLGSNQQVRIVYEDQPVNDFKSLFGRVHGVLPGSDSYYPEYEGVFVTACGTSFYKQCLPDESVHLGISSTAFHWLSESPCHLDGAFIHLICKDESKRNLFAKQAAQDWEAILLKRAKELVSGGRLVIAALAVDKDGQYSDHPLGVKESISDHLTQCWAELYNEEEISKHEFEGCHMWCYYRREDELRAPFTEGSTVHVAGLRLASLRIERSVCPYQSHWLEHGNKDDEVLSRRHAEIMVSAVRTWTNFSFIHALNDTRSAENKAALVDKLFRKYEDVVASDPAKHSTDILHAHVDIYKI